MRVWSSVLHPSMEKKTVEINELQYECMPVLNSNQVHMHVHVSYFSSPFASFNVIL